MEVMHHHSAVLLTPCLPGCPMKTQYQGYTHKGTHTHTHTQLECVFQSLWQPTSCSELIYLQAWLVKSHSPVSFLLNEHLVSVVCSRGHPGGGGYHGNGLGCHVVGAVWGQRLCEDRHWQRRRVRKYYLSIYYCFNDADMCGTVVVHILFPDITYSIDMYVYVSYLVQPLVKV